MSNMERVVLIVTASLLCAALAAMPVAAADVDGADVTGDRTEVSGARDVEETIWYQGFLADVDTGDPINGTMNINASIYDSPTGGTQLWGPETHNSVTVTEGWFHIELGSTESLPGFDEPPYYLDLTVDGEAMDARMKLASVPMAHQTHTFDIPLDVESSQNMTLFDVVSTSAINSNSSIIGRHQGTGAAVRGWHTGSGPAIKGTASGSGLAGDFDGDIEVEGNCDVGSFTMATGASNNYVLASDASGNGTWTSLTFLGDGDWTVDGDDMYSMVSGNIGIGDSTPEVKLDVNGDAEITGDLNLGWDGPALGLTRELTLNRAVFTNSWGSVPSTYNRTYFEMPGDGYIDVDEQLYFRDESDVTWMTFDFTTGYIGIGDTTPDYTFDLYNPTSAATTAVQMRSNAAGPSMQMFHFESTTSSVPSGSDHFTIQAQTGTSSGAQMIECQVEDTPVWSVDVDGTTRASGPMLSGGGDFAEMVEVSSGARSVEAGDVMVIDPADPRTVTACRSAQSSLVAGVVSGKPGIVGSTRSWHEESGESEPVSLKLEDMASRHNEMPLAVVGIVSCKVSAENGPIAIGDLLVTSSTPGHAMRDESPKAGTIVGKALEPLASGTGVIEILVTLH